MIQKVFKVGDSAAVTIPKKSLKELGLKVGDLVSVQIDVATKSVSLTPAKARNSSAHQKKVAALTKDFIRRYRKDLEALADK
jgi:putative addiction module antidote